MTILGECTIKPINISPEHLRLSGNRRTLTECNLEFGLFHPIKKMLKQGCVLHLSLNLLQVLKDRLIRRKYAHIFKISTILSQQ